MRRRQLLGALGLLLAGVLTVAGCGTENPVGTGPGGGGDEDSRARQVADAWRGSVAAQQWRTGFFPLEELVWLPQDAWHSGEDKIAYGESRFTVEGELPAKGSRGRITWQDGGPPQDVEVLSARAVFERLAGPEKSSEGPRLTITGAKADQQQVETSRGPAYIPVWYFTIKGYDQPLISAALGTQTVVQSPIAPMDNQRDDLMPLQGLKSVARDGRSLVVLAGHGACDDGPAVQALETDENVVLTASIRGANDEPCTSQLLVEKVTVKLTRPLGKRVLLDAFSGAPVELTGPGS